MIGTPVTCDPKRLVSGPCWNLYLWWHLFEPLSPCCCHDVPCEQQLESQCVLSETGGMFFRITQNGGSVPALVALWCADKRLFARARWTRCCLLSVV